MRIPQNLLRKKKERKKRGGGGATDSCSPCLFLYDEVAERITKILRVYNGSGLTLRR